jgi:hypothetical protein
MSRLQRLAAGAWILRRLSKVRTTSSTVHFSISDLRKPTTPSLASFRFPWVCAYGERSP